MVYVSYDFYLINLVFIFIISYHSHMCPSPFFTEFSLPRHDRDGYTAFFKHCMISTKDIMESRVMTWIGELLDLNLG